MASKLFKVSYEESLNYEEFIEANDEEEAKETFKKHIESFEPSDGEVYTFEAEEETTTVGG